MKEKMCGINFLPLNVEGWPAFLQELIKGIAWFVSND